MHSHTFDDAPDAVLAIQRGEVPDGDVILLGHLAAVVCSSGLPSDPYLWPITVMQEGGVRNLPFDCLVGETWETALDGRYEASANVAVSLMVAGMVDGGSPEARRCRSVARECGWEGHGD